MAPKGKLHPRNQHKDGYDFARLIADTPALEACTIKNPNAQTTIDFKDKHAVRLLNQALLKSYYGIDFWEIPANYLCPPIPGRVDYIHHLADLLAANNNKEIPRGHNIKVLDIGTGANVVYPLIGQSEYGWAFTGVDIDPTALASAQRICDRNNLPIKLRRQNTPENVLKGTFKPSDRFHITMCNPPFHGSAAQAQQGTKRKWRNLGEKASTGLNFGGQQRELWCPGGEMAFISTMIKESKLFAKQCLWFTSLVSKKDNLHPLSRILTSAKVADVKVIDMAQGQKTSRFIAWTYMETKARSVSSFTNNSK